MATEAQDQTNRLNTPHSQKFLVIPSITLFLCAFLWLKNPFNPRNPRLIKYLRAYKALYICRVIITFVGRPLQISSFLTNKANFRKAQMNITKVLTRDYENKTLGERGKNKANSKPNKANFRKAQMFVTTFLTKEYENISNWALFENKPNTNPNKPNFRGKKMLLSTFCCGISKEKIIFCNLINRKSQID